MERDEDGCLAIARERPPDMGNPYPWHAPRLWHGMRLGDLLRLAAENRFRVALNKLPLALPLLAIAPANSLLARLQTLIYGRKIAAAACRHPPLFIIGHFRSGTTLLYELLARDPNLAAPTAYDCFAASHFVLTRTWLKGPLTRLAPRVRPMDRMPFGLDRPQEDEFALLALGAPTIYRRLGFPLEPLPDVKAVDDELEADQARTLRAALTYFYRALSLVNGPRRLLVKSPIHTGRIRLLTQLFPGAKFVHLVRHPTAMFRSLQHSWRVLEVTQGLQSPARERDRDEMILDVMDRMYHGFFRDVGRLNSNQLCHVRYEDLVLSPREQLQRIYRTLEIGDVDEAMPLMSQYLATLRDYRANAFPVEAEAAAAVERRWSWYLREFGYAKE